MMSLSSEAAWKRATENMPNSEADQLKTMCDAMIGRLRISRPGLLTKLKYLLLGAMTTLIGLCGWQASERPAYEGALSGDAEALAAVVSACNQPAWRKGAVRNCALQARGFMLTWSQHEQPAAVQNARMTVQGGQL